jgi:hypothetical protein
VLDGEADDVPDGGLGEAGPSVRRGEVEQELCRGGGEAARLVGAPTRRVRAHPGVGVAAVVDRPGATAVGGVWSRDADGLDQPLHGVAPAEPAGGAAEVAPAAAAGLELVAARRAHHVANVALEDGGLQRQEADSAVQGVGVLHRHVRQRQQ